MSPRAPAPERDRLAKLLELAGHPSSNETEALNALRAARALLDRAGGSLAELAAGAADTSGDGDGGAHGALRLQLSRLAAENASLRSEAAKLKRANARLRALNGELEAGSSDFGPATDSDESAVRVTPSLVAVFELLSEWRSIPDLMERLGEDLGAARVKRLVRVLDDHGLLRIVDAWPTRYRLRTEGELGDRAKALRTRIEDARATAGADGG